MTAEEARRTPLWERHRNLGGRMVEIDGWELPSRYPSGPLDEVRAVRQRSGLFDLSHTGRLFVSGPNAVDLLRRALTIDVRALVPGEGAAALICDAQGGILSDPLVYRLSEGRWMLVTHPTRAAADLEHLRGQVRDGWDVQVVERGAQTLLLALEGPGAKHVFSAVLSGEIAERLPRHGITEIELYGAKATVARSGGTGEDGFSFVTGVDAGLHLWDTLISFGVLPCGMEARETLRLEAGIPRLGRELDPSVTPWESGLQSLLSLTDGANFTGRLALVQPRGTATRQLAGIVAQEPDGKIERGDSIRAADNEAVLGTVSSGAFSPTLGAWLGLCYLPAEQAAPGTVLRVGTAERGAPAVTVALPFYRAAG